MGSQESDMTERLNHHQGLFMDPFSLSHSCGSLWGANTMRLPQTVCLNITLSHFYSVVPATTLSSVLECGH